MIGFLVPLFVRWGAGQRVARVAAYVALFAAAVALLWALKAVYDNYVVERHEAAVAQRAQDAHSESAADRLSDTLGNVLADKARLEAIEKAADIEKAKPPQARATLPPTTRALNCQLLRENYTPAELAASDAYKLNCKG